MSTSSGAGRGVVGGGADTAAAGAAPALPTGAGAAARPVALLEPQPRLRPVPWG